MNILIKLIIKKRVELDELWHYIGKKSNQAWVFGALIQKSRFFLCFEIGKRTSETCKKLIFKVKEKLRQSICFVSDGYEEYKKSIGEVFETSIQKVTHLKIVKVHKENRFKEKIKKVSIGTKALLTVKGLVTEYIERFFLTIRQKIKCLNRKSLSFSKANWSFENKTWIFLWNYNYVFEHKTLREKLIVSCDLKRFQCKYANKTPAMVEGVVSHRLSINYLFHRRIKVSLVT